MDNKNIKILTVLIVLSLLISSLGTISTYLSSRLDGNDINETTNITTATIKVKYKDGKYLNLENIGSNYTLTKNFTIENTSNIPVKYQLSWEDVNKDDNDKIKYTLINNDNLEIANLFLPKENTIIQKELTISPQSTLEYTLIIEYQNDELEINNPLINFNGYIKVSAEESN